MHRTIYRMQHKLYFWHHLSAKQCQSMIATKFQSSFDYDNWHANFLFTKTRSSAPTWRTTNKLILQVIKSPKQHRPSDIWSQAECKANVTRKHRYPNVRCTCDWTKIENIRGTRNELSYTKLSSNKRKAKTHKQHFNRANLNKKKCMKRNCPSHRYAS